ncbi:hypothetical protein [uncultured Alistipes sp.]|uniref:hypothetical protein n=1 Tax=uncultured Alistipes sp. TaxID=538949 RepID=UPI0011DE0617|nr:hypothetical protein [uncultured Alistipes sp.]
MAGAYGQQPLRFTGFCVGRGAVGQPVDDAQPRGVDGRLCGTDEAASRYVVFVGHEGQRLEVVVPLPVCPARQEGQKQEKEDFLHNFLN